METLLDATALDGADSVLSVTVYSLFYRGDRSNTTDHTHYHFGHKNLVCFNLQITLVPAVMQSAISTPPVFVKSMIVVFIGDFNMNQEEWLGSHNLCFWTTHTICDQQIIHVM